MYIIERKRQSGWTQHPINRLELYPHKHEAERAIGDYIHDQYQCYQRLLHNEDFRVVTYPRAFSMPVAALIMLYWGLCGSFYIEALQQAFWGNTIGSLVAGVIGCLFSVEATRRMVSGKKHVCVWW